MRTPPSKCLLLSLTLFTPSVLLFPFVDDSLRSSIVWLRAASSHWRVCSSSEFRTLCGSKVLAVDRGFSSAWEQSTLLDLQIPKVLDPCLWTWRSANIFFLVFQRDDKCSANIGFWQDPAFLDDSTSGCQNSWRNTSFQCTIARGTFRA